MLAAMAALFAFSAAAAEPRGVALVIGNARYPQLALNNPEADARLVATTLRRLGFDVEEHDNLGGARFRSVVDAFARRLRDESGAAVFYYAGHAVQVGGRHYLLPVDVDLGDEHAVGTEAIDIDERLIRQLDHAESRVRIVILDACRDDPYAGSPRRGVLAGAGLDPVAAPGALIAYSAGPGQVADDGPAGGHSVYTRNLVKEMLAGGVEVEQMFKQVRVDVLRETGQRQMPWTHSSMTADFAFTPLSAIAAAATPAIPVSSRATAVERTVLTLRGGARVAADQSARCSSLLVRAQLGEPVNAADVAYMQAACTGRPAS